VAAKRVPRKTAIQGQAAWPVWVLERCRVRSTIRAIFHQSMRARPSDLFGVPRSVPIHETLAEAIRPIIPMFADCNQIEYLPLPPSPDS